MEVFKDNKDKFGTNFDENKAVLNKISTIRSKMLKNELAGYITKLIKNERVNQVEKTKPLPVIGYSKEELEKIAEFNPLEEKIAEKFWPGAITLILKVKDREIQKSLSLSEKIAVRVPNNKCALSLLKECKLLVGTSANISGTEPFSDPKECNKNLVGYDLFMDGGIISSKGESTIIEIEKNNVKILRNGSISEEMIKELN